MFASEGGGRRQPVGARKPVRKIDVANHRQGSAASVVWSKKVSPRGVGTDRTPGGDATPRERLVAALGAGSRLDDRNDGATSRDEPTPSSKSSGTLRNADPRGSLKAASREAGMARSEREVRTSKTHPLRIDWLDEPPESSFVGLTFAPGKRCNSSFGYRWERDLELDLEVLSDADTSALVCLMEDHELAPNGLAELLPTAHSRGLEVLRLPIQDGCIPDDIARVDVLLDAIEDHVARRQRVVIHCLGGLGRTGTIAGCFLVRRGMTTAEAIELLHRLRGDRCPENAGQQGFIARYEARFTEQRKSVNEPSIEVLSKKRAPMGDPAVWYVTEPHPLADARARGELERLVANTIRGTGRTLVERIEEEIARDPQSCFSFQPDGSARMSAQQRTFQAGHFTTPTIADLRQQLTEHPRNAPPRSRLSILRGAHVLTDIGTLQATAPAGVLFQVASQFNCLEAPGPHIVPVRDYLHDNTQGPRASISALPGTLLRHYRATAADGSRFVQRDGRCLNLLADAFDDSIAGVKSGYLQASNIRDAEALAVALAKNFEQLRVGLHDDVEVVFGHDWDGPVPSLKPRIAQVFTSTIALGGYGRDDGSTALASVRRSLLRAAYFGTLLGAAALRKHTVVLTLIGGGVFGNPLSEIWEAIRWAISSIDELAADSMHIVVNTREAVAEIDRAEVRARGGYIAEGNGESFAITG